jgi:phosphate-selective porin OprO/OprP
MKLTYHSLGARGTWGSYRRRLLSTSVLRITAATVGLFVVPLFGSLFAQTPTPARSGSASTEDIQQMKQEIQSLSDKVGELEDQQGKDEKITQTQKFKNAATVTAGGDGFSIQSADQQFKLRLGTLLQADDREFLSPSNNGGSPGDGFELRRARIIFDGTVWGAFQFRIEPEFGSRTGGAGGTSSTTATLANASMNVDYLQQLQFLAGRFKGPVGYERSQLVADNIWIENGLTQNLTTQYTQGFLVHGDADNNLVSYGAGANEGVRDNANGDFQGMIDNNYDFIGDVYLNPFVNSGLKDLKGLGFGVAGSIGNRGSAGTAANAPLAAYTTPGQTNILTYNTTGATGKTVTQSEDGPGYRLAPVIYYYNGPFGAYADYVESSIRVLRSVSGTGAGNGSRVATLQNEAWQVVGSYVLTGEDASYTGVKPKTDLNFREGTWGAFQLVARYGQMTFDSDYFSSTGASTGIGGPIASQGPKVVTDIGVGLNWYLNSNVKAQLQYDNTSYTGGVLPVTPQNGDQNVFLTQLQLAF